MKKEAIAGAVLALLIVLSAWNIYSIDALTDGISDSLRMSQALADIGDFDSAKTELDKGLKLWLNADGYTHIFLRHPEIDSTTDAFYELQELLLDGGGEQFAGLLGGAGCGCGIGAAFGGSRGGRRASGRGGGAAAYDKLRYHLESIRSMEHISIGSVL